MGRPAPRLVGLGFLLAMLGCQPAPAAPPPGAAPAPREGAPTAPAAKAEPRGTLRFALSALGTSERWLPHLDSNTGLYGMGSTYEHLVNRAEGTGKVVPGLAERWEAADGGRQWTLHLRRGVQFHDAWGELTAEDVKFSLERHASPESIGASAGYLRQALERIEVADPYQVVLYLKNPAATLPLQLTSRSGISIISKQYVEKVGEDQAAEKPVGTGPYRLVEHQRRQLVRLEAVKEHWRKVPGFQTVVLRFVADPAARFLALRSGDVEVAEIPVDFKAEASGAGLTLLRIPHGALLHVHLGGQMLPDRATFDPKVPWVGDPADPASLERALKVRKAMALAVNREEILKSTLQGEGELFASPWFPPGSSWTPPELKPYPYDPAAAKRLLREAGYEGGFEVEMRLVTGYLGLPEPVDVGEAVAGYWEKDLGLKVRRVPIDYTNHRPQLAARKTAGVTWVIPGTQAPEPFVSFEVWVPSWGTLNALAESQTLDEMFRAIQAEGDPAKRIPLHHNLARHFYESYYGIPIATKHHLLAAKPGVIEKWDVIPGWIYVHNYEYIQPAR